MEQRFNETIVTHERLRQLYRQPSYRVLDKVIDHLDQMCRSFIVACPFVVVATRGADGRLLPLAKGRSAGLYLSAG